MDRDRSKILKFLDYTISSGGKFEDVLAGFSLVRSGKTGHYMACANPHSLVIASKDAAFKSSLQNADILLPDGAGIVLAARILCRPIKERVAGSDFFLGLSEVAEKEGQLKYFFLGSTQAVLERIQKRLAVDYPSIRLCGVYSPPYKEEFDDEDNKVMIDLINEARPDVLWVGMTAPKQEKWIFQNRNRLNVPFTAAIGAVFDFYAGSIERPSERWQRLGLEWLGRFLKEPRRLWQRNLISMPIFLYWVMRAKLHNMVARHDSC